MSLCFEFISTNTIATLQALEYYFKLAVQIHSEFQLGHHLVILANVCSSVLAYYAPDQGNWSKTGTLPTLLGNSCPILFSRVIYIAIVIGVRVRKSLLFSLDIYHTQNRFGTDHIMENIPLCLQFDRAAKVQSSFMVNIISNISFTD